jgi:hypothetical protein
MADNEATAPNRARKALIDVYCPHCGTAQPPVDADAAGERLAFHCLSCGQLIVLGLEDRT